MAEEKRTALVIKEHDFKEATRALQKYTEQAQTNVELSRVPTDGGLFNLGNHKVTGDELNGVTSQIQNYLIKINTLSQGLVDEFGQVYKAFEALDKDYIAGIVTSIKAAEKVSEAEQEDRAKIKKTVEKLDKTVDALARFKLELDKIKHLTDVDQSWQLLKKQEELVKTLSDFKLELAQLKHIKDVDKIWERVEANTKKAGITASKIDEILKTIESLDKTISAANRLVAETSDRQNRFIKDTEMVLAERQASIDRHLEVREKAIQDSMNGLSDALIQKQVAVEKQLTAFTKEQAEKLDGLRRSQDEALKQMATEQVQTLGKMESAQKEGLQKLEALQSSSLQQIAQDQATTLKSIKDEYSEKMALLQSSQDKTLSDLVMQQTAELQKIEQAQNDKLSALESDQVEKLAAMNKTLEEEKAVLNNTLIELSKRVKISHIVAGASAAIVVVQFILNIMGVI